MPAFIFTKLIYRGSVYFHKKETTNSSTKNSQHGTSVCHIIRQCNEVNTLRFDAQQEFTNLLIVTANLDLQTDNWSMINIKHFL